MKFKKPVYLRPVKELVWHFLLCYYLNSFSKIGCNGGGGGSSQWWWKSLKLSCAQEPVGQGVLWVAVKFLLDETFELLIGMICQNLFNPFIRDPLSKRINISTFVGNKTYTVWCFLGISCRTEQEIHRKVTTFTPPSVIFVTQILTSDPTELRAKLETGRIIKGPGHVRNGSLLADQCFKHFINSGSLILYLNTLKC